MQLQEAISTRQQVENTFKHDLKVEHDRQHNEVRMWLSGFDNGDDHSRHRDARIHPASGHWLLTDHRFENWKSLDFCSTPLLWMTGIPGAGKPPVGPLNEGGCRSQERRMLY